MRVLLVEDDPMIGAAVTQALRDAAYAVDWIDDGRLAATALVRHEFDMVLLDLGLPGKDGITLLRDLRRRADAVPVLVITARDAIEQRIEGLDLGADEYLVKPFAVGELMARMRAVTRRGSGHAQPIMDNGRLALDPASKSVVAGGDSHALSKREFALLHALMLRPGAVLSRQQLEERI